MYFPCSVITNTQSMKKLIFMRQIGILGFDYWSAPLSIILRISSIFFLLAAWADILLSWSVNPWISYCKNNKTKEMRNTGECILEGG